MIEHFKDSGFVLVSVSFFSFFLLLPRFCQFDLTKLCSFHYSFYEQPQASSVLSLIRTNTDMWSKYILFNSIRDSTVKKLDVLQTARL